MKGSGIFLIAVLFLLPFSLRVPNSFSFLTLSLLHLTVLLGFSLFLFLLSSMVKKGISLPSLLFWIGGLAVFVSILFRFTLPQLTENLLGGLGFIFRRDAWLSSISEFQPLLLTDTGHFQLDIAQIWLTRLFVVFPILFIPLLTDSWGIKEELRKRLFLILWTVSIGIMTLFARRHIHLFAVNIALLLSYFFLKIGSNLKKMESQLSLSSTYLKKAFSFSIILLLLGVIIQPSFSYRLRKRNDPPPDVRNALLWLRDNTPPAKYWDEPFSKPEYSVMSRWDYRHFIVYIGQRPVVISNLGNMVPGFQEGVEFFLLEDEEEALRFLQEKGVRFLFLHHQYTAFPMYCTLLDKDVDEYFKVNITGSGKRTLNFQSRFLDLVDSRLYYFNGTVFEWDGKRREALEHFRLLYESRNKIPPLLPTTGGETQIYEFVSGVSVSGKAEPGEEVMLSIPIETNQGRSFRYENRLTADSLGHFEVTLPYATEGNPYPTRALEPYRLSTRGKSTEIHIQESDLLEGKEIFVDLR
jgi:asparagine N-glycosylation enzyme membrane subunit Stt3